jgi:hypothetical protein
MVTAAQTRDGLMVDQAPESLAQFGGYLTWTASVFDEYPEELDVLVTVSSDNS